MEDPKKKLKKAIKSTVFDESPDKAVHNELMDHTELLDDIKQSVEKIQTPAGSAFAAGEFLQNFLSAIKGEKGNNGKDGKDSQIPGPIGPPGPEGKEGKQGLPGIGMDGINGKDGKDGRDGRDGKDGKDGRDGKDGDSVSSEQIIEEIKKSRSLDISHIKNGESLARAAAKLGKIDFDDQRWHGGGKLVTKNAAGVVIEQHTKSLKFVGTSNPTVATDGAGNVTVTINGGGESGFTELPATGTVNSSNQIFTFTQLPTYIVSDHAWYKQTNKSGTTNWTWNVGTLTATLLIPPPQEDIFGVA